MPAIKKKRSASTRTSGSDNSSMANRKAKQKPKWAESWFWVTLLQRHESDRGLQQAILQTMLQAVHPSAPVVKSGPSLTYIFADGSQVTVSDSEANVGVPGERHTVARLVQYVVDFRKKPR
jgi:hypothetical protein